MRFFAVSVYISVLAASALAAVTPLRTVEKYDGETTGKYIVKLKDGVSKSTVLGSVRKSSNVTEDWEILNGFAAQLDDATLNELRASDDVEYIAEDGVVHAFVTQTNAPWGLARLSSATRLTSTSTGSLTFSYTYDAAAGSGVDIYILDTGVLTTHSQFGGRARWGATFGGYANADGHGHGTHVAGTAAGSQFGVAKAANIIAVKVLSDSGSGSVSNIVSGLNYVLTQSRATGRPSIASLSLGGGASTPLDSAVASLTSGGVHVTVAAGNSNTNAANTSPARAPSAITVGASTIADARASFSNYGAVVDVFAPGANVISSWIGSNTATNSISGTSMATPHVAGLVAYLISVRGNGSPAAIQTSSSRSVSRALSVAFDFLRTKSPFINTHSLQHRKATVCANDLISLSFRLSTSQSPSTNDGVIGTGRNAPSPGGYRPYSRDQLASTLAGSQRHQVLMIPKTVTEKKEKVAGGRGESKALDGQEGGLWVCSAEAHAFESRFCWKQSGKSEAPMDRPTLSPPPAPSRSFQTRTTRNPYPWSAS
ncbi:unnamed protein product [Cyclocybe aegerita]|uniref:Uncharacterized protein n=1 Tax=Cyclocybe aegerita TaxID=1973307 RepID=A0A8S0X7J1_CYCAE|nr:unnamed protein product [Cyclocybe aegerita]